MSLLKRPLPMHTGHGLSLCAAIYQARFGHLSRVAKRKIALI